MTPTPTSAPDRIESLDLLRGFALLGILLLNILGFGLVSVEYSNPGAGLVNGSSADVLAWALVELTAEGAMRALFSILFGAGVLLFADGRSGRLHYRRTAWLMVFGLFDAFVLLWNGDILIDYALAGALLYLARNWSARALLISAGVLLLLASLQHGVMNLALSEAQAAAREVAMAADPAALSEGTRAAAAGWHDFAGDFTLTPQQQVEELAARRGGYASAFVWNAPEVLGMLTLVLPLFLFWDALMMMLLGMGLYRLGVLQGDRSSSFYLRMALIGFAVGLAFNSYEVARSLGSNFDLLSSFAQMQWTYHIGRLGMALGWLGLLIRTMKSGAFEGARRRLAAVGRMALTNYLMHSFIALLLFTGAGLGLVGELSRAALYLVVVAIWILQLWLSPWWLARYRFGPLEWLWRALTYGTRPPMAR